jgi:hypothetical protein
MYTSTDDEAWRVARAQPAVVDRYQRPVVAQGCAVYKRDAELVAAAGSCADCPKRTGHNKLLFGKDFGRQGDQCTVMASVVNLHALNSGRLASSFYLGRSSRIAVYLFRGNTGLPSFFTRASSSCEALSGRTRIRSTSDTCCAKPPLAALPNRTMDTNVRPF